MFEWARQTTGDLAVVRTMAIQALVTGRIIYLLSVSHLGKAIAAKLRGKAASFKAALAIGMGISVAIVLQGLFSQWGVMNTLFGTAPLNLNQWLLCLIPVVPMIILTTLVNRLDPTD